MGANKIELSLFEFQNVRVNCTSLSVDGQLRNGLQKINSFQLRAMSWWVTIDFKNGTVT